MMNLQDIIDDCASLYVNNHKPLLLEWLLPEICNIIHGYYFDEFEFEEQVLQRGGDMLRSMTDTKCFFSFLNNGQVFPHNSYAQQWLEDSLSICEAFYFSHFYPGQNHNAYFYLSRILLPEINRLDPDNAYFCKRPSCFWRTPPYDCECSKPLFFVGRDWGYFMNLLPYVG